MNHRKILINILILSMVFQMVGFTFAAANINVAFDRSTANVGDQVNLIVTIANTGPNDLSSIFVSAPLPNGLKFMMSATGTTKNLYNPDTGVWQVDNLKLSSQGGGIKTLTITAEVTPELTGDTITASASYISVFSGDPPVSLPLSSSTSDSLTIIDPNAGNNTGDNTGNNTGNTNNTNNNNIPENSTNVTSLGNALDLIGNIDDVGIQDIGQSEQIGQKAYEISNENSPNKENQDFPSTIWGLLIISGVIILGYLVGIRNN
jgi:uncharacterized repeat protein (TIGR01451 family)